MPNEMTRAVFEGESDMSVNHERLFDWRWLDCNRIESVLEQ